MMQNKKWLTMLVAFVVSIGLWFYVVTVENPVKEITLHNVPISFSGQELLREDYELLVVDSNALAGVDLTFTGKISDLNKLQQNKQDIELRLDISHLRSIQDYSLPYDISDVALPAALRNQDVSLSAQDPEKISVTIGKLAKKTIPVEVRQDVYLEDGFTAGRLTQNYQELVIEGPEAAVKLVSKAQALLERENVSQTINATLPLYLLDENGAVIEDPSVQANANELEVSLPVLLYRDIPLEAPVIEGGGATEKDVVIDIKPKTIRLSGEASVLEALQSVKLSNIDLASLMTNEEVVTRSITVPEGCTNLSGEVEAQVSVQVKNKAIRKVSVSSSNFQAISLPSDRVVSYKTTALTVTIRANEADIDQITEENVRVVVDFTDLTTSVGNNISAPVRIYIDGFEGAGVVGSAEYTVLLDVAAG